MRKLIQLVNSQDLKPVLLMPKQYVRSPLVKVPHWRHFQKGKSSSHTASFDLSFRLWGQINICLLSEVNKIA